MRAEVKLPELGVASGDSILLSVWLAQEGDIVYQGDRLVEVLVAGATFDVSSPADGKLSEILAYPQEPLHTGQVLALVDLDDGALQAETDEVPPAR
jgi:pyruvate/2-oxoglutarate dehydrogenase complex dihydrolipoamide acyltransferase (E2) component